MVSVSKPCMPSLAFLLFFLLNFSITMAQERTQVPCFFIFGSSLSDNGNNNRLPTAAKVNYQPYGIDFARGPTGRSSNGKIIPDYLAEYLGIEGEIQTFATANGPGILNGVNYASIGAGIRDETGRQLGGVISLNGQLANHAITITKIAALRKSVIIPTNDLQRCLYTVDIGQSDYINNYLMPQLYPTSRLFTPDQYATMLVQEYSLQLKALYKYNARKIAVFGLGNLGCIPRYRNPANGYQCDERINNAVQLFNHRLRDLVDELNGDYSEARFTFINRTSILSRSPAPVGIRNTTSPCCVVLTTTAAQGFCAPGQVPCPNRNEYYFWDDFNPTQVGHRIVASNAYNRRLPSDAQPVDIHTLVQEQI